MQTDTTAPVTRDHTTTAAPHSRAPMRSLDDLAALSIAELTTLYRGGTLPGSLRALDGAPRCRMLAVRGLEKTPAWGAVRAWAASSRFLWAGKRFSSRTDHAGDGINRVRLAGERAWYPFETRVEPSVIDGEPCILLDYDLPANPPYIRAIRDELREIEPGLMLGPAMLDTQGSKVARLVLYFACDWR